MSKLKELANLKKEYYKKIKNEGEAALKADLKAFLEKYPFVEHLIWDQYTPYFNDGDACVFSVNEVRCKINDFNILKKLVDPIYTWETNYNSDFSGYELVRPLTDDEIAEDDEMFEYGCTGYHFTRNNKGFAEDFNTLSNLIESSEDILEIVFGDHVEVKVTKDEINVNEVSHD